MPAQPRPATPSHHLSEQHAEQAARRLMHVRALAAAPNGVELVDEDDGPTKGLGRLRVPAQSEMRGASQDLARLEPRPPMSS